MKNSENLEEQIRKIKSDKNCSLLEAIMIFCNENVIDPETLGPEFEKNQVLKHDLYVESMELRLVERVKVIDDTV